MVRLRREVEGISKASQCAQIVRFYGLTFHEVINVSGYRTSLRGLYFPYTQLSRRFRFFLLG